MHSTLTFIGLVATFITSISAAPAPIPAPIPAPQAVTQFDGLNINNCPDTTAARKALFLSVPGTTAQGKSTHSMQQRFGILTAIHSRPGHHNSRDVSHSERIPILGPPIQIADILQILSYEF